MIERQSLRHWDQLSRAPLGTCLRVGTYILRMTFREGSLGEVLWAEMMGVVEGAGRLGSEQGAEASVVGTGIGERVEVIGAETPHGSKPEE